jgi:predicted phage baseplate assembly protein
MVAAGQLSQPLDRPQGLLSVTNPSAASGAADPASADDARTRAPLPTLTIGRVVSLEDYQNFAVAFPGIAKAMASWTWFSGTRGVFLTVAGEDGAVLAPDDPVVSNLLTALRELGNPYVPLQVAPYSPRLFQLAANIKADQSLYDIKQVLAQVWQNLSAHFAFDQRLLGQNVTASEVIGVIQGTTGVLAVQLLGLFLSGAPAGSGVTPLCASGPMPPAGAQLLLLDPASQGGLGVWS